MQGTKQKRTEPLGHDPIETPLATIETRKPARIAKPLSVNGVAERVGSLPIRANGSFQRQETANSDLILSATRSWRLAIAERERTAGREPHYKKRALP